MTCYGLDFEPSPVADFLCHRFPGPEDPHLFFSPQSGAWFLANEHAREPMIFSTPGNERAFYLWLKNKLGDAQDRPPQRLIVELAPETIEAMRKAFLPLLPLMQPPF